MFWHYERLSRLAIALTVAITLALVIGYATDEDGSSLLRRGDFPGFLVLSKIITTHDAKLLYDPDLQRRIENELWPAFEGTFYMSVYPPYVAWILSPLGHIPPQMAQMLFTLVNAVALILAVLLVGRLNPSPPQVRFPLIVLTVCFTPIFYAIFAAQNTGLSMLLYASLVYGIFLQNRAGDILAGLSAGLWLFKPQFGLLAISFCFILRRPMVLAAAALPALLYYIIAWNLLGFDWPVTWWQATSRFASQNLISNAEQMVSLIASVKIIAHRFGLPFESRGMDSVGIVAASIVGALVAWYCLKVWRDNSQKARNQFALLIGPAVILLAPQTLFYDLGIAWISLLCVLDFTKDRSYWIIFALSVLALPITFYRALLPVSIFALFAFVIAGIIAWGKNSTSCRSTTCS